MTKKSFSKAPSNATIFWISWLECAKCVKRSRPSERVRTHEEMKNRQSDTCPRVTRGGDGHAANAPLRTLSRWSTRRSIRRDTPIWARRMYS
jgi:hypothetical protein